MYPKVERVASIERWVIRPVRLQSVAVIQKNSLGVCKLIDDRKR